MQADLIQRALVQLKTHGFDLRLAPALAGSPLRDQASHALAAAAALLDGVAPHAFDGEGTWAAAATPDRSALV